MTDQTLAPGELLRLVFSRFSIVVALLIALFFIPAGTLAYWEAWIYLGILLSLMLLVLRYLFKNDPELLARRMRLRERETAQKRIIQVSYPIVLLMFLLPGFDRRWEWSQVPAYVVALADVLVVLGYGMFFLVMRENPYASRIVEVEKGQRLITTGPYAWVRHPMYLGVSLLYVATPPALGSYWAVLPALLIVPLLVVRIIHEEKVLQRNLPGYAAYQQTTRYRLIPGLW